MTLTLPLARARATMLAALIEPHVRRAEIVGSVRRYSSFPRSYQRSHACEVKDIELLVEPEMFDGIDLFNQETAPDVRFLDALIPKWGLIVKGGGPNPRYVQIQLKDGLKLDLFLCWPPAEWGTLMAIRTGPAEYSRYLVTELRRKGWRCERGTVWRPRQDPRDTSTPERLGGLVRFPTPDESDFFEACGVEMPPPHRRGKRLAQNGESG